MALPTPSGGPAKPADAEGDVYVISFPKCRRTWLRVLMAKAISTARGIPMEVCRDLELTESSAVDSTAPPVVFWHDDRVPWRTPAGSTGRPRRSTAFAPSRPARRPRPDRKSASRRCSTRRSRSSPAARAARSTRSVCGRPDSAR